MELSETQLETYTNIEVSLTAKGTAQWSVKCKYATTEKVQEELSKSIDIVRTTLKEKGIAEAGSQ